ARFGLVVLPNRRHTAELHAGLSAGFFRNHAGADVLFRLRRYMRFNLFAKPFARATADHEIEKSFERSIDGSHARFLVFASKKRAMIAAVCSQSRFSACKTLWPARVSR